MRVSASEAYATLFDWADVIVVEHPWQFRYVAKRTADTPLVYSSHNVETELYAHMEHHRVTEPFYRWLYRLERRAVCDADLVVTTSERDRAAFRERYHPDTPFHVAPNATGCPESDSSEDTVTLPGVGNRSTVACFVGSDHPPNVEAVRNIARIARSVADDDIEFVVIGSVCDRFDPAELPDTVHLLGFVDDLDAHLRSCDIALNPVTTGSGTNVKVPEYMAHGLPVVSTPFGARGIPVTDGEEILVRELSAFPRTLVELRSGKIDATALSARAKQLVETELNWQAVSRQLFERLGRLSVRSV